jgi:hypothetical protein
VPGKLPQLLWWLRPNTFQSDDASAVAFVDRFRLRYREADWSMLIEQDIQNDPHLVAIERGSMHVWEPPHHREEVSEEKKDQIIENMRRAFATRGYQLVLLDRYYDASTDEAREP